MTATVPDQRSAPRKRAYRMVARAEAAAATRDRLLVSAWRHFAERPFERVRLADVAREAGGSAAKWDSVARRPSRSWPRWSPPGKGRRDGATSCLPVTHRRARLPVHRDPAGAAAARPPGACTDAVVAGRAPRRPRPARSAGRPAPRGVR